MKYEEKKKVPQPSFVDENEWEAIKANVSKKVRDLRKRNGELVAKFIAITGETSWRGALKVLASKLKLVSGTTLKNSGFSFNTIKYMDIGSDGPKSSYDILEVAVFDEVSFRFTAVDNGFFPMYLNIDAFIDWDTKLRYADALATLLNLFQKDKKCIEILQKFVEKWEPRIMDPLTFDAPETRRIAKEIDDLVIG